MSEWKEDAVARRVFRQARGGPEIAKHRPKRRARVCGRSSDGQHDLGPRTNYQFNTGNGDKPVGYSMAQCTLCGKKLWGNLVE